MGQPVGAGRQGPRAARQASSSNSKNAYGLFFKDGRLKVDIKGSDDRFTSNTVFSTDTWYHIAVTFDGRLPAGERVKLYVNGNLDRAAEESSTSIPDYASRLFFGHLKGASKSFFSGMLDDVRVYDRALAPEAIQAVMNGDGSGSQAAARASNPPTQQADPPPVKVAGPVDVQSAFARIKARVRKALAEAN